MVDLKLARLPDRTPIKLTVHISPELAADLSLYSELYREHYNRTEPIEELAPAMLSGFLEGDRAFVRARREAKAAST